MSLFVKFAGFIGMTVGILSLVIVAGISIGAIVPTGATPEDAAMFGFVGAIICIFGGMGVMSLGD